MKSIRTYSIDTGKSVFQIKNPNSYLNIELYKVLEFDTDNKKMLVKIYNEENPIWLFANIDCLQYKTVTQSHIIDNSGIYILTQTLEYSNPRQRQCYQCEYDEYIAENHTNKTSANAIVWKTVSDYFASIEQRKYKSAENYYMGFGDYEIGKENCRI
jgi:hypothetical protein